MVTKNLIDKTITDILNTKCSGGNRFRFKKGLTESLNKFREKTMGKSYEQAQCLNSDGEVLYENDKGESARVALDLDDIREISSDINYEDIHLTHNHPMSGVKDENIRRLIPTGLSYADMDALENKTDMGSRYLFKSITAESSWSDARVTLIRGDNFSSDDLVRFGRAEDYYQKGHINFLNTLIDKTNNHMLDWSGKQTSLPTKEEYFKEVDKYVKSYVDENYPKFIGVASKKFDKCNMKLKVSW